MEIAKRIIITALTIAIGVCLIWLSFSMGCAQFEGTAPDGTYVKVNTILKDFDIDELTTLWGTAKHYDSNSNPVNVITPYGAIESK